MPLITFETMPPVFRKILDVLGISAESAIGKATELSNKIGLGPEWNQVMSEWIRENVSARLDAVLVESIISTALKILKGEPLGYWKDAGGSL